MHLIIKPVLSLRYKFERFDRAFGAAGFLLKLPFLSMSVFYSSADVMLTNTFHYAVRRKQFVVVGSDDFYDALKTEFAETLKQHEESSSRQWAKQRELSEEINKLRTENHTLRAAIKIVSIENTLSRVEQETENGSPNT